MKWNRYINDGTAAVRRADYSTAEKRLVKALAFAKEHFSRNDSRLALTLSLLGHVYFKNGEFRQAEKLLEQSLRLHAESDHLNDPCVLMDLFTLAEIKQSVGKAGEAWQLYEDTLSKIKKATPFQADIIEQASELFKKMADQIKPEEPAEPPPPPVVQVTISNTNGLPLPAMECTETADPSHVWQQQFQTGLASMKMDDAEFDELITAYLNFESAYRLAYGLFAGDDMRLIATIKGLADASTKLNLFDQAESLYRQAWEQAKTNTVNATQAEYSIRLAMGFMYVDAGQFASAKTMLDAEQCDDLPKEAEPLRKRLAEALRLLKAYDTAQNLLGQAEAAEQINDLDRAAKLANNALSQLKQAFPPHHLENARLLRYRASILARLGNAEQAEELEKRAERIERTNQAQQDDWLRRTAELPRVELDPVPA